MSNLHDLELIVKILRIGGQGSVDLAISLLEKKIEDYLPYERPPISDFAKELKILRNAAGFTQAQLAKKLEVSPASIGQWERSECLPRPAIAQKIKEFFNE